MAREHTASVAVYERAATPVFALLEQFGRTARAGEERLAEAAAQALNLFDIQARRGGAPEAAMKPARYALALLIDRRARQEQGLRLSTWSVLAGQRLFDGREITPERLRDFRDTARRQGREFDGLAQFIDDVLARIEGLRHGPRVRRSGNWGGWIAASLVALVLALAGYAAWIEFRFQRHLSQGFEAERLQTGLDRDPEGGELIARLDRLAEARDQLARAVEKAPFRRVIRLPFVDSQTRADRVHAQEVNARVPRAVADAIELAIATEGESTALYDALRAWSVLSGDSDWQPAYVVGWLEDYQERLGYGGLSAHAATLSGPEPELLARDPVLMEQARRFAAEAGEPDRAWLELLRAEATRALPRWQPETEVPGLSDVVLRRSGKPVGEGLPGLFTQAGWNYARDFGIGDAVQRARDVAPAIAGKPLAEVNATPDQVLDRLAGHTIEAWKAWLADLRVRPFVRRETAIEVSGKLALTDNPISALLRRVWQEAGGLDRQRSHPHQLQLAREFGPMIQYVDEGRMNEISRLFATLNVALGSIDLNAERGGQRLLDWADTARSVQALKAAPLIVVQIAEDVLAQSAGAQNEEGSNPLTQQWQKLVYPACRDVLEGRFPFGDGGDADVGAVASLLAPDGQLITFAKASALRNLETGTRPWRWKPEARFSGLKPESAQFFERAFLVSEALFGQQPQIGLELTLAALAERGETVFALGGQAAPVRVQGDPARLSWPGPDSAQGVDVAFRDGTDSARIIDPGPWGFVRLMDGLRLRLRDDGQRVLLDLRTESGRVFLDVAFDRPVNPVSALKAIRGFSCPAAL